ncbi:DnaJ family domain-containing protein [Pseudalkalibacillus caeni]|uniref:DUF1992 domain-containing protein n=1 Tax=Exobacillus caeni TaxID=2574798 RepID=A0A5R9EZY6_9BACL|nr:DnaJ family domain-containing protein [Pseudalkalibacillus caeni]TLS35756.1 DUF1992 domain-containing protein [Pseudalkalibacillus caeni]
MDIAWLVAENKIKEAMNDGEFDNLPGKGKPLQLDDLSSIPEELRMGYRLLKNAGYVPEEVQLKKEMMKLEDLLDCCKDEKERQQLKKKLSDKLIRFDNLIVERKMHTPAFDYYRDKIYKKIND